MKELISPSISIYWLTFVYKNKKELRKYLTALTQYTANQYVCLTTNLENDIKSLLLRLESLHLALRSSRYKAMPSAASSKENGSMLTYGTWAGSAYDVKAEPKYFGKVNGFQYKREATA